MKARERILAAARGTYTVMDIETTGMYSDITEIAALRVVSGEIRDTFHTLVKAKGPIEKRVERLTGILPLICLKDSLLSAMYCRYL